MIRRFASNRLCSLAEGDFLRNQVVEVEVPLGKVVRIFPLEEEIRHTEWLGGLILLSVRVPVRKGSEAFADFLAREKEAELCAETGELHAFHVTSFNVSAMEFTVGSRVIPL